MGPRRPEVIGSRMPPRPPPREDVEFPPREDVELPPREDVEFAPADALVLLGVNVNAADAFHVGAGVDEVEFAYGACLRNTVMNVV
jgi:hypothetical protein